MTIQNKKKTVLEYLAKLFFFNTTLTWWRENHCDWYPFTPLKPFAALQFFFVPTYS